MLAQDATTARAAKVLRPDGEKGGVILQLLTTYNLRRVCGPVYMWPSQEIYLTAYYDVARLKYFGCRHIIQTCCKDTQYEG